MPENNNNELRMSAIHDRPNRVGNGVESLMRWVRLLLPVAIAGIGWYLGHTVGKFEDQLQGLDDRLDIQEISYAANESEDAVKFADIIRRLDEINARDIRDHMNLIGADQYRRDIDHLTKELQEIETQHKK